MSATTIGPTYGLASHAKRHRGYFVLGRNCLTTVRHRRFPTNFPCIVPLVWQQRLDGDIPGGTGYLDHCGTGRDSSVPAVSHTGWWLPVAAPCDTLERSLPIVGCPERVPRLQEFPSSTRPIIDVATSTVKRATPASAVRSGVHVSRLGLRYRRQRRQSVRCLRRRPGPFQRQERVGEQHHRHVMVPAAPGPPFERVAPEGLRGFPIQLLDRPPLGGRAHVLRERPKNHFFLLE